MSEQVADRPDSEAELAGLDLRIEHSRNQGLCAGRRRATRLDPFAARLMLVACTSPTARPVMPGC